MNIRLKLVIVSISTVALTAFASSAQASNLLVNGNFESTTNGTNKQVGYNTNLTGWTLPSPNNSYTFVFAPGAADTVGAQGQYGNLKLWGPNTGVNNGLPAASPAGGNFLAYDSAFQNPRNVSLLSQTVSGLTVGQKYAVSFWEGAAQQKGYDGATHDQWEVTFGGVTQNSTRYDIPNHGFSGWFQKSLTFTAQNATQTLSFYANGGPQGVPPFALLDGVSLQAVPEPQVVMGAVTAIGFGIYMKRKLAIKKLGKKK